MQHEAILFIERFFASRLGETITRGLIDAVLAAMHSHLSEKAAEVPQTAPVEQTPTVAATTGRKPKSSE